MKILKPSEHIVKEAKNQNLRYFLLETQQADAIRKTLVEKFIPAPTNKMWDGMMTAFRKQDPEGWKRIASLVYEIPFLLLFDVCEDNQIIAFHTHTNLGSLLENCFGFEFYVTDFQTNFLVCFNDHDFIISTCHLPSPIS